MNVGDNLCKVDGKPLGINAIKLALGVKGRWPARGLDPLFLGNVLVWVEAKHQAGFVKKPRLACMCPLCGGIMNYTYFRLHINGHLAHIQYAR